MRKNKKIIIALVICVAIFATAKFFIKSKKPQPIQKSIEILHPFYGTIENVISVSGNVESQNRLEIIPPISGRIEEILCEEGNEVKKGAILAWMSSTERAALLDAARSKGEEAFQYWQDAYRATPLVAPIDGVVIKRSVEPGQTVTATTPVLVLSDRLIVKAWVDESDISKVQDGQKSAIRLDAYPQVPVDAEVTHISYDATIANNVTIYEVDILPQQVPEFFRSGMSASVDIIQQKKENVLLIPFDAVENKDGASYVNVKQPNAGTARKKVVLGMTDQINFEVISGLSETDEIILQK
ncbi:MAG: HlyD family efflux transporter periplasmic adaptor subunit [Candidatus Omnitrophica bacterium]|nr:HlyD family efflux transporter periplasmic adaptor subunit [Candidatus Omnitrophota bacterium]